MMRLLCKGCSLLEKTFVTNCTVNTAFRITYNIYNPRDVHMIDLYLRANLFPLVHRRKYFMLNMVHRLLCTNQIEPVIVQRTTRQNMAPVLQQYVPLNDTIGKSPVFLTRHYWNNLHAATRNIVDHEQFKNTVRKMVNHEYITAERARLAAGQFT